MSVVEQADSRIRMGVLVAAGIVAGGLTAVFTDSVLPPAAVFAGWFVLLGIQSARERGRDER